MAAGVPDHIHNQRTKLFADALNTAATSSFAVGILAPIAAAIYTGGAGASGWTFGIAAIGWTPSAMSLHLSARRVLGNLRP